MILRIIHTWEIIKQVIVMFFATYFIACIWYYYVDLIIRRQSEANNFNLNFGLVNKDEYDNFVKTWYFIFTTLVTVGYGDFYATNKYEMGFAIILLLAGPTWFAFMMGKSINVINILQDISGTKNKKIDLQLWVYFIEEKSQVSPNELKSKIFNFYTNYWKNDRLKTLENTSTECSVDFGRINDRIFLSLPNYLRKQIFDYIFSDIFFQYCHFFNYFGDKKYEICSFIRPICYNKDEVLLNKGEEVNDIVFLLNGRIEVGVNIYSGFVSIGVLHKNLVFGDYFALKNIKSYAVFRASSYLKGYYLSAYVLRELVHKYKISTFEYLETQKDQFDWLNEKAMLIYSSDTLTSEENQPRQSIKHLSFLNKLLKKEYFQSYIVDDHEESVNRARMVVKDIKYKIKESDENMKSLISQVKEKLVENILKRNPDTGNPN